MLHKVMWEVSPLEATFCPSYMGIVLKFTLIRARTVESVQNSPQHVPDWQAFCALRGELLGQSNSSRTWGSVGRLDSTILDASSLCSDNGFLLAQTRLEMWCQCYCKSTTVGGSEKFRASCKICYQIAQTQRTNQNHDDRSLNHLTRTEPASSCAQLRLSNPNPTAPVSRPNK